MQLYTLIVIDLWYHYDLQSYSAVYKVFANLDRTPHDSTLCRLLAWLESAIKIALLTIKKMEGAGGGGGNERFLLPS